MGGGDLNTKKSWHPNTMKNQERVWKAEQQEAAEKKRLNELRREITEERNREELKSIAKKSGVIPDDGDDKKLEWMYRGPSQLVNREEYLLGRTVDKTFEDLDAQEKAATSNSAFGVAQPKNHVEHECIPFSIRQHKGVLSNDQVDLARKLMEDPLMLIKQKEIESRQKLLQNPVKLKELHRLLKNDRSLGGTDKERKTKDKKSKKYKKASKKKHKKHKKASGSSDSESDSDGSVDLDQLLAEKYKKVQHSMAGEHQEGVSIDKLLTMKYDKLSRELDKMGSSKTKKKKTRREPSRESSAESDRRPSARHSRRNDDEEDRNRNSRLSHRRSDQFKVAKTEPSRRRSRSRSDERRRQTSTDHSKHRHSAQRQRSSPFRSNERITKSDSRRYRSRSRSIEHNRPKNTKRRSASRSPKRKSPTKKSHEASTVKSRKTPSSSASSTSSSSDESTSAKRPIVDQDSEDEKRAKKIKNFGLVTASGEKLHTKATTSVRLYNRDEIKAEQSRQKPSWSKPAERKRPLTEEEMEEKRRAMQENAQWREEDRSRNVKRYEAEDHRENAKHGSREYDREFLTKQFKRAAASETVESRIRSNRNNIQRSNGAMDSNFAKR
ncbi:pre-mRNA-splicing factor CWC25 homolog isoform X1 [Anopheles bellator]|uniref:pre-mRNA-splicing factor CWC25 homolog isoform X1 n=1 Tax=Anopheles bellator TaxID=139047 RepID=UPI00264A0B41|nr:pre-mRNA-splicing factor CWC25 homolog isoform X1 [Anopheles bellator]